MDADDKKDFNNFFYGKEGDNIDSSNNGYETSKLGSTTFSTKQFFLKNNFFKQNSLNETTEQIPVNKLSSNSFPKKGEKNAPNSTEMAYAVDKKLRGSVIALKHRQAIGGLDDLDANPDLP